MAYGAERVQFGKTIDNHQLIQEHYSKMLGNITSSIALCTRVSAMLDEGTQKDEHAALAKEFATSRMRETVACCSRNRSTWLKHPHHPSDAGRPTSPD